MDNFDWGYVAMGIYCLVLIVVYVDATRRSK